MKKIAKVANFYGKTKNFRFFSVNNTQAKNFRQPKMLKSTCC